MPWNVATPLFEKFSSRASEHLRSKGCESVTRTCFPVFAQRSNIADAAEPVPITKMSYFAIARSYEVVTLLRVHCRSQMRNLPSCRKTRIQGHPAIHKNACSIDVIGLIGSQEHRNSPDVVWLADAFVGNQRHERFIRLWGRPCARINRCPNCARANAVDTDTIWSDLLGDALHHQHDS